MKGSEKQVAWANDIAAKVGDMVSAAGGDERVRAMADAVRAMPHAKMVIDLNDAAAHPSGQRVGIKLLHAAYVRGQEIARTVRDNAGKVAKGSENKVLGNIDPASAAFAYAALRPDAETYDGYGQTAAPMFHLWLTGELPLPANRGA